MASIVQLFSDEHQKVQMLLPWYVSGTLDAQETASVEAHLQACPDCQAELASERLLKAEFAGIAVGADKSWSELRNRIAPEARRRSAPTRLVSGLSDRMSGLIKGWRRSAPWMQWAVGLQAAGLVAAAALFGPASPMVMAKANIPAAYHVLGAAPGATAANLAVMFRPDATVSQVHDVLGGIDARVVDGPSSTGVYMLRVGVSARGQALSRLHAASIVQMAEPVDQEGAR
jgi:anti-sigma factor RsiW